jgi:transcriptional regulator with XRE-family HTH domain
MVFLARITESAEMNLIGNNVKKYRLMRKYTQKQLSAKLETIAVYICRGSIARIEGKTRTVTDIELWGLATVLDVPICDLFDKNKIIK